MDIWLVVGLSTETGQREVFNVLFSADLIEETVKELFEYFHELNQITVETWYREEGTNDACFYDQETFYREDE